MLIEAARRAETAAKEMLAAVADGSVSCEEIRQALAVSKAVAAINTAFQAQAAAAVAGRERHGDGGAEILAQSAGLSRGEARSHINTAQALRDLPAVRDAVESGLVSHTNAKQLAAAAERAGSSAVASDSELLSKAQTLRPEQFAREARRWVTSQDRDDGAAEHARQRARRKLRVWNADNGMTRLYGEFDTVTGTRIANRLRACASHIYDTDKKNDSKKGASNNNAAKGGVSDGGRSFDQCMADALEQLTANDSNSGSGKPIADICIVAHVDEATGKLIAELPDRTKLPEAVLEELACTAKLTGVIYDRQGKAIWRAHAVRCATDSQRQLLTARDGGCFGCDAHPGICDAHHVTPVSQGGTTKLDNLVLACWRCHHKIHHLGWQIHGPPGHRSLHPPDTLHHGPAHSPDQPTLHGPRPDPDELALFNPDAGREEEAPTHSEPDSDEANPIGRVRGSDEAALFDPDTGPRAAAQTEPQSKTAAPIGKHSDRHPTGPAPPTNASGPPQLLESADARDRPASQQPTPAAASQGP